MCSSGGANDAVYVYALAALQTSDTHPPRSVQPGATVVVYSRTLSSVAAVDFDDDFRMSKSEALTRHESQRLTLRFAAK